MKEEKLYIKKKLNITFITINGMVFTLLKRVIIFQEVLTWV